MPQQEHTDVLIIGSGFGGMNAALTLERLLKRRLDATVTLVSRTNFYLFTPLLAEVAASLIESRHAVNPVRRMLKRVRFLQGTIRRLDPKGQRVQVIDENAQYASSLTATASWRPAASPSSSASMGWRRTP